MGKQPKESVFHCQAEFGARTRQPMVKVSYEGPALPVRMSPEKAMELAMNLLAAAHSALTDAFFIEFMETQLKVDEVVIMGTMAEFRHWRKQREP